MSGGSPEPSLPPPPCLPVLRGLRPADGRTTSAAATRHNEVVSNGKRQMLQRVQVKTACARVTMRASEAAAALQHARGAPSGVSRQSHPCYITHEQHNAAS